jgi:hypothetical protein
VLSIALAWLGPAAATADPELSRTVVDFGEVAIGDTAIEEIAFSNDREIQLSWGPGDGFKQLPFYFDGHKRRQLRHTEPGETNARNAFFSPLAVGRFTWNTVITVRRVAAKPGQFVFATLPITLTGVGVGPGLEVTTTSDSDLPVVDFGDVIVGSTSTVEVMVTNHSDEAVTVDAFKLKDESGTFAVGDASDGTEDVVLGPGESASVGVGFTPDETGKLQGKLVIKSAGFPGSTRKRQRLALELVGQGVDEVGLSTDEIRFGKVDIGSENDAAFVLTNRSGKSHTIGLAKKKADPAYGVAVLGDVVLDPGASREIGVTFDPERKGRAVAKIVLRSDGFSRGKRQLVLKAKAVKGAPPPPGPPLTLEADGVTVPIVEATGAWLDFVGDDEIRFIVNGISEAGGLSLQIDVGFPRDPKEGVAYDIPGADPVRRIFYEPPGFALMDVGMGEGFIVFDVIIDDGPLRRAVGHYEGLAVNRFGESRTIRGTFDIELHYEER